MHRVGNLLSWKGHGLINKPPRLRILLVEDDPIEADLITAELGGVGSAYADVTHHALLRAAVAALGRDPFDIVLLDLNLPDGSGVANLHRITAIAPHLPVIIMTNLEDEESAAKMLAEGAQDYLIKRQITGDLLRRAIRYAVARHEAEASLRASEERYALALAGARDGIWDWDLLRDEIHFSARWFELLQLPLDTADRRPAVWLDRVHPDDRIGLEQALRVHVDGETPYVEHEHRISTGTGHTLWVLCRGVAVRDQSGRATRIAGSMTDISDRKLAETRLMHEALHDTLTGLPNRTLFLDRLDMALKQQRRDSTRSFAVLFLDIDGFKTTNDSLGHTAGDELLVQFGSRLRSFLRPGDSIARLGGDEFAILLADVASPQEVTRVAERIQETLSLRFLVGSKELYAGASVGIALSNGSYDRPGDLLRDADTAMYQSKNSRRGSYIVFNSAGQPSALDRLELETDLRSALRQNQMITYYQPIVSLDGLRVLGFEALLRWLNPVRGMIGPEVFIPLAEKCGTISALSWWVMHDACRQTRAWQISSPGLADLTISVNVSSRLLSEPDFAARTAAVLDKTGLAPRALRLEVTEDALLHHEGSVVNELQALHRLGVKFYLDDFGTGYSSLSYLNRFDYDTIKIDRSFIAAASDTTRNRRIVDALISLATVLGIDVIAEGVETEEQAAKLRALNCRAAQGYLFSRPVPAETASELLLRERARGASYQRVERRIS
jgi:diguanylate cyclase (GGDEF)-like protein/PAS domain S-box-containing protein